MKNLKVSLLGIAVLTVTSCAILAKVDWEQKTERLQVINQINHEEINMLKSKIKELSAEIEIKETKIVELESQPK